jgi:hypothetical protein
MDRLRLRVAEDERQAALERGPKVTGKRGIGNRE